MIFIHTLIWSGEKIDCKTTDDNVPINLRSHSFSLTLSISPRSKFILIILNNAKNNTSSRLNLPLRLLPSFPLPQPDKKKTQKRNKKSCSFDILPWGSMYLLGYFLNVEITAAKWRAASSRESPHSVCVFTMNIVLCYYLIFSLHSWSKFLSRPSLLRFGAAKEEEDAANLRKVRKEKTTKSVIITCMHNFLISLDGRAFFLR